MRQRRGASQVPQSAVDGGRVSEVTIAGTDTSAYEAGSEYAVKVDPENRQNLTFAPA